MNLKCIDGPHKGRVFGCRYNSIYQVSGTLEESINRAHERGSHYAFREVIVADDGYTEDDWEHVARVRYNWFVDNGEIVLKFDESSA